MANASIPLQVQPIRIPDPLEGYSKAMTLKALLGQQKLQDLQIGQTERGLARQARRDEIARQSGGDLMRMRDLLAGEGFIDEALDVETKLIGRTKAEREAKAAQFKLLKEQADRTASLASSVLLADPTTKPQAYAQARVQAISEGLIQDADPRFPTLYSPQVDSVLRQASEQALSIKDALERMDYAALGQGAPQAASGPTTMGEFVAPSQATSNELLAQTGQGRTENVTPTATRPTTSPDEYRAEARRLRGLGTKAGFELAKDYEAEANRLDDRIFKEREQQHPVSGAPGVTFDKNTGRYLMDGKPISAAEVQKIAAAQKKAGASSISIGAMSPENAAKTELLNQGISDMAEFKAMLIREDGGIDRQLILGMATPGMAGAPGTDARIAWSLIYNAIEAKLRAESGQAVTQTEVERIAGRFIPSPLDNDATVLSKVRRMEAFLRGSFQRIKGAGEATTPQGEKPPAKKGVGSGTREDPWKIKGDAGYDSIKSGEYFIGPDGQVRRKP